MAHLGRPEAQTSQEEECEIVVVGAWGDEDCVSGKRTKRDRRVSEWMDGVGWGEVRGEAGYEEKSRGEVLPTANSKVLGGPRWGRSDRGSGDVAYGEWARREPKLWTDGFGREGPTLVGRTDDLELYQAHLNLKGLLHPCL
jgi:hypothetical protein